MVCSRAGDASIADTLSKSTLHFTIPPRNAAYHPPSSFVLTSHLLISLTLHPIYANSPSTVSKCSKNPANNFTPNPGSKLPVVARILCMLSCGKPASIARIPVILLNIGPTVPPDLESFRIWKTWSWEPHFSAMRVRKEVLKPSVVMWALESAWMVTPMFSRGVWSSR